MKKQILAKKGAASVVFTVLTALLLAVTPASAQEGKDILPPSDVDNVKASAGNGQVTLSWDVATDNTGIAGYNIYYGNQAVTNEGGEYTEFKDAGNVVEFTVDKLENGKAYYFAVTAYDAAGNESESYSFEASATPVASEAAVDTQSPQVAKTEARYQTVVKVVFSEEVKLPEQSPELAFSITNTKSLEVLDVVEALTVEEYEKEHGGTLFNEEDESVKAMSKTEKAEELKKSVVLITEPQAAKEEYKVEVSIDIEDMAGNPVASGTSDTGVFEGSGEAEPKKETAKTDVSTGDAVADASSSGGDAQTGETDTSAGDTADTEAPKLLSAKALSPTEVEVKFSEKIQLNTDPTNNFLVVSESNADKELPVIGVVLDTDGMTVKLTTDTQEATNYSVVALEVKDLAGNSIAVENASVSFAGKEAEKIADKIAPENVTNFVATVVDKVVVKLSWTASVNSAGDLADQMLYRSEDGSTFANSSSVGKDATQNEVKSLTPGKEYWFKLTTKDESGNESDGVITKIMLPETGPVGAAALMFASAFAPSLWRRKNKK